MHLYVADRRSSRRIAIPMESLVHGAVGDMYWRHHCLLELPHVGFQWGRHYSAIIRIHVLQRRDSERHRIYEPVRRRPRKTSSPSHASHAPRSSFARSELRSLLGPWHFSVCGPANTPIVAKVLHARKVMCYCGTTTTYWVNPTTQPAV